MSYTPTTWVDNVTKVGPTNLNHGKQAEGGASVEALRHAQSAARSTGRVDLIKRK